MDASSITAAVWSPGPTQIQPDDHVVDLWKADLALGLSEVSRLSQVLNTEELERANRFVFEKDRHHFVAARGILRHILARYVGVDPAEIKLTATSNGKLRLSDSPDLRFNLSHSQGLALYAFSLKRELGLDVERIHKDLSPETVGIVRSYFSEAEKTQFFALAPDLRPFAFYLSWTRKEAYLKARGEGLQRNLGSFDVSVNPEGKPELISEDASRWELMSFFPGRDFVATLVMEGKGCPIRFYDWQGAFQRGT